jgi:hypothetical protein
MEMPPPKLVERMLYDSRNHPEMGWLEILPPEPGKEVRETYIENGARLLRDVGTPDYMGCSPSGSTSP